MDPNHREIGQASYRVRYTMPYGVSVNLQVVYTENTEYHLQGRVCVGVKVRQTNHWDQDHRLLGHSYSGIIKRSAAELNILDEPVLGGRMWFVVDSKDVLTSPIVALRQPTLQEVKHYFPTLNSC